MSDDVASVVTMPLTRETATARAYQGRFGRIPGNIRAVDFDEGPEGMAFHNVEPISEPDAKDGPRGDGLAYRKTPVEIEIGWGTYMLAAIRAGEWVTYSVFVAKDDRYNIEIVVAGWLSGEQAGALRIEFDGEDKTGEIIAPDTGKWYIFRTVTVENVALKKGFQTMRVVFTRGDHAINLADIRFVPVQQPWIP